MLLDNGGVIGEAVLQVKRYPVPKYWISIGRKSFYPSSCGIDLVLPSDRSGLSRLHCTVSYFEDSKKWKVKAFGTSGIQLEGFPIPILKRDGWIEIPYVNGKLCFSIDRTLSVLVQPTNKKE
jgi:hypothetical protein